MLSTAIRCTHVNIYVCEHIYVYIHIDIFIHACIEQESWDKNVAPTYVCERDIYLRTQYMERDIYPQAQYMERNIYPHTQNI